MLSLFLTVAAAAAAAASVAPPPIVLLEDYVQTRPPELELYLQS